MKKLFLMFLLAPVPLLAETTLPHHQPMVYSCVAQELPGSLVALDDAEALRRYTGYYQLDGTFGITVSVENGKLYGLAPGDAEKTEFTPVSENKFLIHGPETEVEFLEENGKVQYMVVHMQGGLKLKKVK